MTDPDVQLKATVVEKVADKLAHHAFSHIDEDGWAVCLCGYVCIGDDDDGSRARHQAQVLESLLAAERERIAATLRRDHDAPPDKDRHSYRYRNGWWDGVHHAAQVVESAPGEEPPRRVCTCRRVEEGAVAHTPQCQDEEATR